MTALSPLGLAIVETIRSALAKLPKCEGAEADLIVGLLWQDLAARRLDTAAATLSEQLERGDL